MKGGRLVAAGVLALVAVLSVSAPGDAITYGAPDTSDAFVGAFFITDAEDNILGWCSGSLISDRVFLTAGHCVVGLVGWPVEQMFVTFGADMRVKGDWLAVSGFVLDPQWKYVHSDPHDIGLIFLANDATGVPHGELAPAGFLDDLAAAGKLVPLRTTFQVVGYGLDENMQPTYIREVATPAFLALEAAWLSNSENPALGFSGACNGDSGGPVLYTSNGVRYIVSIVSIGDTMCRALDKTYRVDTASAHAFIDAQVAESG